MEQVVWFFSDAKDTTKVLTIVGQDSAKTFVSLISPAEHGSWLVKKYGEEKYRKLSDCKELVGDIIANLASANADSTRAIHTASTRVSLTNTPLPAAKGTQSGVAQQRQGQVINPAKVGGATANKITEAQAAQKLALSASALRSTGKTNATHVSKVSTVTKTPVVATKAPVGATANSGTQTKRVVAKPIDTRQHDRVEKRLRIMIVADDKIFRTYCKNISLGGILLENDVPAELRDKPCRIIIGSEERLENIELSGVLLGDDDSDSTRFRFEEDARPTFIGRLNSWIHPDSQAKEGTAKN